MPVRAVMRGMIGTQCREAGRCRPPPWGSSQVAKPPWLGRVELQALMTSSLKDMALPPSLIPPKDGLPSRGLGHTEVFRRDPQP